MKHTTLALLLWSTTAFSVVAQDEDSVIKPILLDKAALSGVGLGKIDVQDEPDKEVHQKQIFAGTDISVFVVSTETWNNPIESYPFDEYVYLYHGQSIVKSKKGPAKVYDSGDHLFVPKGFEGEWEIRAGETLHYELSVITTRRAPAEKVAKEGAKSLSGAILSGGQIVFTEGLYAERLFEGAELLITLKAEQPRETVLAETEADRMIHLLSGQLTIVDEQNEAHTYYSGDFVVLPRGVKGQWKSDGLGLLKYLVVEKAS